MSEAEIQTALQEKLASTAAVEACKTAFEEETKTKAERRGRNYHFTQADGNCGVRVLAKRLDLSEEQLPWLRNEVAAELRRNPGHYSMETYIIAGEDTPFSAEMTHDDYEKLCVEAETPGRTVSATWWRAAFTRFPQLSSLIAGFDIAEREVGGANAGSVILRPLPELEPLLGDQPRRSSWRVLFQQYKDREGSTAGHWTFTTLPPASLSRSERS